jgi:hypothetical protein
MHHWIIEVGFANGPCPLEVWEPDVEVEIGCEVIVLKSSGAFRDRLEDFDGIVDAFLE